MQPSDAALLPTKSHSEGSQEQDKPLPSRTAKKKTELQKSPKSKALSPSTLGSAAKKSASSPAGESDLTLSLRRDSRDSSAETCSGPSELDQESLEHSQEQQELREPESPESSVSKAFDSVSSSGSSSMSELSSQDDSASPESSQQRHAAKKRTVSQQPSAEMASESDDEQPRGGRGSSILGELSSPDGTCSDPNEPSSTTRSLSQPADQPQALLESPAPPDGKEAAKTPSVSSDTSLVACPAQGDEQGSPKDQDLGLLHSQQPKATDDARSQEVDACQEDSQNVRILDGEDIYQELLRLMPLEVQYTHLQGETQ